jgi:hypothetical protein
MTFNFNYWYSKIHTLHLKSVKAIAKAAFEEGQKQAAKGQSDMENCNHKLVAVKECTKCGKTFDTIVQIPKPLQENSMENTTQAPKEANADRMKRMPKVLIAYAKDIRSGVPLDSGADECLVYSAHTIEGLLHIKSCLNTEIVTLSKAIAIYDKHDSVRDAQAEIRETIINSAE